MGREIRVGRGKSIESPGEVDGRLHAGMGWRRPAGDAVVPVRRGADGGQVRNEFTPAKADTIFSERAEAGL